MKLLFLAALFFVILYFVIKTAVKSAMREVYGIQEEKNWREILRKEIREAIRGESASDGAEDASAGDASGGQD